MNVNDSASSSPARSRSEKTPDSRHTATWAMVSAEIPALAARSTWTRTQNAHPFSCDTWIWTSSFSRSSMPASSAIAPTVLENAASAL